MRDPSRPDFLRQAQYVLPAVQIATCNQNLAGISSSELIEIRQEITLGGEAREALPNQYTDDKCGDLGCATYLRSATAVRHRAQRQSLAAEKPQSRDVYRT